MFFPAADTIAFAEGGAEVMRIDSSGNVGIGTSSPTAGGKLDVNGISYFGTSDKVKIYSNNVLQNAGTLDVGTIGSAALIFNTANTERARITSGGNFLVGQSTWSWSSNGTQIASTGRIFNVSNSDYNFEIGGSQSGRLRFYTSSGGDGTTVGSISVTTGATAYNTSSDYRLKNSVTPIASGLATVGALRPVTYKWNIDDSDGEGFIAHELKEIIPLAVTGEKDAVDADGKPIHQGVDYSKIVVHLVAAIQELKAQNDELKARVEALEAK
jgi:uncharacterized protein YaiE (UPF0345 family)